MELDQSSLAAILQEALKSSFFSLKGKALNAEDNKRLADSCLNAVQVIEQQLNSNTELLEEEKLYLQQEASSSYAYSEIIGSGPEIKEIYSQMSQVAFANSTVLIQGETGTGKELVARGIHNTSPRKDKLMVKVNCAFIP